MRNQSAAMILLCLGVAATYADDLPLFALRAEGQALFHAFRDLESLSHGERIRILQQAEECIQRAQDLQAFRRCERAEGAAREALRARLRGERDRLRERRDALLDRPPTSIAASE